jgi:oligopeptidase B
MPNPPVAPQRPHSSTQHGVTRQDPWAWLRAENWRDVFEHPDALPSEIRAVLEAENAYVASALELPEQPLIDTIYAEIRGRIEEDSNGIPSPDGPYAYNFRMEEGKQYPVFTRTPREGGAEEILLDGNLEAGSDPEAYFALGAVEHSPDHRLLGWGVDRQGAEIGTVTIRDLATGEDTAEVLENVGQGGSFVWAPDSRSLYYIEYDDNMRPYRVRQHVLGTPQAEDRVIYEETDPGFFVGVGETQSRSHIVITADDNQTSEVRVIAAGGDGTPRLVEPRRVDIDYDLEEREGVFYILTNADGAEDYKIVTAPVSAPSAGTWTDLVPHQQGVLIVDMIVLRHHLIRLERVEGLSRLVVRDLTSHREWTVGFDEEAYALGMGTGYEFDTATIRFSYASPTTPSSTYDLNLETGERTLLKVQRIPSGHDPAQYETRRIFARASDGEAVPITLLYKKGTPLDGTAPGLITGYGAYGMAMPAGFSVSRLSLVDRGAVYAIAHVRGGMDKGYRWYRMGRREHKVNTFTDFIAAAEALIAEGYVAPERLVAEGGSAGGLLMGAVANMRPELFAGILAFVPFVDVLNTMLDDTLPLTPPEWLEWGNPITDPEAFRRMHAYSPYDNVRAVPYPAILALAGLTDPRVTYWEPAKWVAKLRATTTGSAPIYLKTHMGAGHGGASGRFEAIKETALAFAFALKVMRLT